MGKKSKKGGASNKGRTNNKKKNRKRSISNAESETPPLDSVVSTEEIIQEVPDEEVGTDADAVADKDISTADVEEEENDMEEKKIEEENINPSTDTTTIDTATEEDVTTEDIIPAGLESSLYLLTESQQTLAKSLCSAEAKQRHLFERWPTPSKTSSPSSEATNNVKRRMMTQLENMDKTYPSGGLLGYIANAQDLLQKSKDGVNPLDGWSPSVPQGESFQIGTSEYSAVEKMGLSEVGKCGFVLVAGGLGERLGYGDIKIGLPTEMATETTYIQYYIETILAYQAKYAKGTTKLPLCIMTSGDTNAKTVALLTKHNYFGLDKDQVTIVQQGDGVPALEDNDAKIALDPMDSYTVLAKPHGHGDIHALLHSHEVAKKWLDNGIKWTVFFQDTNGLAFHTLPLALGVSSKLGLVMNSITVPRKAKQAVGGITLLKNESGEEKTINVEYNQLDPMLRAAGFPDGDVNDEKTGFSPFPGNINQLVFQLKPYVETLERTKGAMPEFVNPKYKDEEKTIFKKPTRLECMMQDFPTCLEGEYSKKVGFTSIAPDLCFSPVKNTISDGAALQKKNTAPGTAASGEADQYAAIRKIMTSVGCQVEDAAPETFGGISVIPGPAIVLKPSFASCPAEYKVKFPSPSSVKISKSSTLVVNGSGVVIKSLDLDGALVIDCEEGATGVICDLVVKNKGWEKVADESSTDEIITMRGYSLSKHETKTIVFKKDETVEGLTTPLSPVKAEVAPPQVELNCREIPDISTPVEVDQSAGSVCGCIIQ